MPEEKLQTITQNFMDSEGAVAESSTDKNIKAKLSLVDNESLNQDELQFIEQEVQEEYK